MRISSGSFLNDSCSVSLAVASFGDLSDSKAVGPEGLLGLLSSPLMVLVISANSSQLCSGGGVSLFVPMVGVSASSALFMALIALVSSPGGIDDPCSEMTLISRVWAFLMVLAGCFFSGFSMSALT